MTDQNDQEPDRIITHPVDLDDLVARHRQRITRLTGRLLERPGDVEDVVQDIFVSVVENIGRFRGTSRFETWLTSIVLNRCRSHERRRRFRELLLPWLAKRPFDEKPAEDTSDAREAVRLAVAKLPTNYREPIVLRYMEQMEIRQIGEVLGISEAAVEVRLHRARQKLKILLNCYEVNDRVG